MFKKSIQLFLLYAGTVLFFLSFCCFNSSGQSFTGYSINPKAGIYRPYDNYDGGVTGGLELDAYKGNTIYSIDYFVFGEFTLMDPIPADAFNQLGFMIGTYTRQKFFRVLYQAGLAAFFGKRYTESVNGYGGTSSYSYYEEDRFFTPGLAAKLALKVVPFNFLSLGIDLQTNINLKQPVFFPCLSLEVGRLKK